jgi:hypothetical protein
VQCFDPGSQGTRDGIMKREMHGMSKTPEYRAYHAMKQRCFNVNGEAYANYGGRGIHVHDGWMFSFLAFYKHIGPRPTKNHSIDRIDNDKGYCPGNVRWATRAEQNRNRRPYSSKYGRTVATRLENNHADWIDATSTELGVPSSEVIRRLIIKAYDNDKIKSPVESFRGLTA